MTQPILDSDLCTPTWARMVAGGMQVDPPLERVSSQPIAAQFIARQTDSLTQPFLLVERFVADYELPADFTSDVDINGSAARVDWVDGADSGGITWRLADGSEAFLRSQGFTRDEALALARSLIQRPADSNVPGFDVQAGNPFGVAVVDETNGNIVNPRRAASSCRLDNGSTVTVNVFERYLVAVAAFIIDHPEEHVLAARDLPGADDRVLVLTGTGRSPAQLERCRPAHSRVHDANPPSDAPGVGRPRDRISLKRAASAELPYCSASPDDPESA